VDELEEALVVEEVLLEEALGCAVVSDVESEVEVEAGVLVVVVRLVDDVVVVEAEVEVEVVTVVNDHEKEAMANIGDPYAPQVALTT